MCGKRSGNGSRIIVIGLSLLLLLASPCFAASSWEAIFSGSSAEAISTGSQNQESQASQEASSQALPTGLPQTFDERTLRNLQKELARLQETQESLEEKSAALETSATAFLERSKSLLENGEITEAQYQEMLNTAAALASANASQADRIAKLEAETGTKAYLMVDGIVGFDEMSMPEFGAGLTIGARIGNDFMLEAGADYMIGGINGVNEWSLDNWQFRLGVGWMF